MLVRISIIIVMLLLSACNHQPINKNDFTIDPVLNKSFNDLVNPPQKDKDDELYEKFKNGFKLYKGDDKRENPDLKFTQIGIASWYGYDFHGKETASGEIYNMNKYTAAHRKLPLGTKIKVTNLRTKKWVIVTINDRGPYIKNRILDLSKAAKEKIELDDLEKVKIERI